MAAPASGFQMKNTLLYYRKLYFTTENFTLLQKILLHEHDEKYFFYKTCVPFTIRKSTIFLYQLMY